MQKGHLTRISYLIPSILLLALQCSAQEPAKELAMVPLVAGTLINSPASITKSIPHFSFHPEMKWSFRNESFSSFFATSQKGAQPIGRIIFQKECRSGLSVEPNSPGCLTSKHKPVFQLTKSISLIMRGNRHNIRGGIKFVF